HHDRLSSRCLGGIQETFMRRIMLFAFVALAAFAGAGSASAQDCFPPCREGYLCHQSQCVSACNPACEPGERCTSDGQCVSASASQPVPPAAAQPAPVTYSSQPDPYAPEA